MALHINKDRDNLDTLNKTLTAEDFVNSILDGLDIKSDKNTSSSNDDDIFYEWSSDFDYGKFLQDIDNKRNMTKYSNWKQYESKD
jgi:hypothetical protein